MTDAPPAPATPAPAAPPAAQPAHVAAVPTKKEFSMSMATGFKFAVAGFILLAVATGLNHAFDHVQFPPDGDFDEYDSNHDGAPDSAGAFNQLDEDQDNYLDMEVVDHILEKVGTYFSIGGIVLVMLGFVGPAFTDKELDARIRIALIIAAGFLYWIL